MKTIYEKYRISKKGVEIIGAFCRERFKKLTLKELSKKLNENPGTIRKRIQRDKSNLIESDNSNPKHYWIKPGEDYIVFHCDNFKCRDCKQKKDGDKLTTQTWISLGDEEHDDHYSNQIVVCKDCLEKRVKKADSKAVSISEFSPKKPVEYKYEYKEVRLDSVAQYNGKSRNPVSYYYTVRDPQMYNEQFHLTRKVNGESQITSRTRVSILDAYGEQGWNVVKIYDDDPESPTGDCKILFKRKIRIERGGERSED